MPKPEYAGLRGMGSGSGHEANAIDGGGSAMRQAIAAFFVFALFLGVAGAVLGTTGGKPDWARNDTIVSAYNR